MNTAADRAVLDEAWGLIPQARERTQGEGSFTRARVDRIITIAAAFGSLALGTLTFLNSLTGAYAAAGWDRMLLSVVLLALVAMVVSCLVGRGVKILAALFAFAHLAAVIAWPFTTINVSPVATPQPWIWYLINIATVAALLAFPLRLQVVWVIATPVFYGVARMVQSDFDPDFIRPVWLDVVFAVLLGSILLVLAWVFRSSASNVDETRKRAVTSYARAAATSAKEEERVAVAALMHDSVLAALIAAERADSERERQLAVAMAREALTRLANAEGPHDEGSDEPVDRPHVALSIERAARDYGVELTVHRSGLGSLPVVPGRVARALVLAATQAIANAVQHAGGAGLRVNATAIGASGITVAVKDEGPGVDLDAIPEDRLGIRGSIIARVAAVGGVVDIESSDRGTTVTMSWAGQG